MGSDTRTGSIPVAGSEKEGENVADGDVFFLLLSEFYQRPDAVRNEKENVNEEQG